MRRALPLLLFVLLLPTAALAAESTFFGPIVPPECNCEATPTPSGTTFASAANWGCVLQTVQNGMNLAVSISIILLLISIVYAGILFMTSAANPQAREAGRRKVMTSFLGMIIVLGAWMFVDFIMKVLYNPDVSIGTDRFGPWNEILTDGDEPMCFEVAETPGVLPGLTPNPDAWFTTSTGGVSGGSCQAPSSGPCSVASLQSTCLGPIAAQAAQICSKESGGNPRNESRTDKTSDGHAYSVGLFQINLTNSFSRQVNGKNCSRAFSEPCQGGAVTQSGPNIGRCRARVIDMPLYQACKTAAMNVGTNIAEACRLHDGDWGRWRYSARSCRLPY